MAEENVTQQQQPPEDEPQQERIRKELCNTILRSLNYELPTAIPDQLKVFTEAYRAMFGPYQGTDAVDEALEEQVRTRLNTRMIELLENPRVMSFSSSVKTLAEAYGNMFGEHKG